MNSRKTTPADDRQPSAVMGVTVARPRRSVSGGVGVRGRRQARRASEPYETAVKNGVYCPVDPNSGSKSGTRERDSNGAGRRCSVSLSAAAGLLWLVVVMVSVVVVFVDSLAAHGLAYTLEALVTGLFTWLTVLVAVLVKALLFFLPLLDKFDR